MRINIRFNPQDIWVGVYWEYIDVASAGGLFGHDLFVWVCIIPMLPLNFVIHFKGFDEKDLVESMRKFGR